MKKVDAKIGYDAENRVLDVYISPTFNVKNHKTITDDAKVVLNFAGNELADIKILLSKDVDELKQYGDGSGCSVCLSLKDLDQELDELLKKGSEEEKEKKEKEEEKEEDYIGKLIKIMLLID